MIQKYLVELSTQVVVPPPEAVVTELIVVEAGHRWQVLFCVPTYIKIFICLPLTVFIDERLQIDIVADRGVSGTVNSLVYASALNLYIIIVIIEYSSIIRPDTCRIYLGTKLQ